MAETLATEGLAGLWVTGAADLAWLTGFTGSNGAVFVRADGRHLLATDARYAGRVDDTDDLEVRIDRDLFAPVATAVSDGLGPVAFDPTAVSHARARTWSERTGDALVARTGLVGGLRLVKDDAEVGRLARACDLTVAAWRVEVVAAGTDLVGVTERELATRIERTMVDLGADGVAFPSIVAAGTNGAVPHHEPTDRPIRAGELVTTDIGARVDGYHADFTRTVAVGEVDDDLLAVHALVERAQAAGVAAVRVGEPVVELDTVARRVITEGGHGDAFVHGVGHGVGLEVHEDPIIALATTDRLSAGMVLTIEPGIYLPGHGGVRIEDTLVVTDDGPRVLTDAPTGAHPSA
nr:aminopeptidase P family protein [Salsipaludibacter albus]